jgi:hypothetical protein
MPQDQYQPLDDLSDVTLEGRQLVSDVPSDWLLCSSLRDTTDLLGWWEDLMRLDDNASQAFSPVVLQELRSLQAQFQEAYESDHVSAKGRRLIRSILVSILSHGLTTEQAAVLCGSSRQRITQLLYAQYVLTPRQIEVRMGAETLLRSGLGPREAAFRVGMTRGEIEAWTAALSIKSQRRNRHGKAKPKVLRDRAMELYDTGMRGVAVVKQLQQEMPEYAAELDDRLISQWASRSGRTKKTA